MIGKEYDTTRMQNYLANEKKTKVASNKKKKKQESTKTVMGIRG